MQLLDTSRGTRPTVRRSMQVNFIEFYSVVPIRSFRRDKADAVGSRGQVGRNSAVSVHA